MDHPHIVLGIDSKTGDFTQRPVVRQRLRPEWIDLELRRGIGGDGRRCACKRQGKNEKRFSEGLSETHGDPPEIGPVT